MRLDPYNRILRAARTGSGVRLSAAEVCALARDGAIATRAHVITEEPELWLEQMGSANPDTETP